MSFPFTPGLTEPKLVDLSDPSTDLLLNADREELTEAVRRGDLEALAAIEGSFAAVAREGVTIRLARTIGRPLRYFVAKRETGPYLVVADRIDAIAEYCRREGIAWQFHPSYTRLVPAHYLTELDQVGCPDPNPRYSRFFDPEVGTADADIALLGGRYADALETIIERVLAVLPAREPIGIAFSGGADSSAVAALLWKALLKRNQGGRAWFFTLSVEGGSDRDAAAAVAESLGFRERWSAIEAPPSDLDLSRAVAAIEDYRPLDVQCAAAMRALLGRVRRARPDLVYLFDGDGGDENWKSYPLSDSDITIRSVLNNPLLYHEGWGVDSIKHSLTYSGGFSRGVVRGFAPAREYGFRLISPHAMRPAIAAALSAPLRGLVGEDAGLLAALKGKIVRAGLASRGLSAPFSPKRRFQEGASGAEVYESLRTATRSELRSLHQERFARWSPAGAPRGTGAPEAREPAAPSPPA
jgi:asparagine synthase (glutamine-hydrolysing)